MDNFEDLDKINVTVWTRSYDVYPGIAKQTELISRMSALQDEEVIDTLSIRTWGKYVATTVDTLPKTDDPTIRNRVAEFWSWADQNGYNLEPAFEHREMTTVASEESTDVINLPILCLEVRSRGRLVGVFPCEIDGETYCPMDCVERFESLTPRRGRPDPAN